MTFAGAYEGEKQFERGCIFGINDPKNGGITWLSSCLLFAFRMPMTLLSWTRQSFH
jgi:hypothetical protein